MRQLERGGRKPEVREPFETNRNGKIKMARWREAEAEGQVVEHDGERWKRWRDRLERDRQTRAGRGGHRVERRITARLQTRDGLRRGWHGES